MSILKPEIKEYMREEFKKLGKEHPTNRNRMIIERTKKKFNILIDGDDIYRACVRYRAEMKEDIDAVIAEDRKETKAQLEHKETDKKYKSLLIRMDGMEKTIETLAGVKETSPKFTEISSKDIMKSEATAVMVASDWHLEEVVDPETINNLNAYNPTIAQERAENFFKNGLKLTQMMGENVKIENMVLAMLGDFISGYIHDELVEGNAMSPTQALIFFRDIVLSGIQSMLDNSDYDITVICKFGNHGRTTDKIRVSTGYKNSYEWLMYHMIASEFKDEKRLNFIIENGYHTYFRIYDTKLRLHHGDALKYGGGVGGIYIPVNKSIGQWNKAKHANIDVFGHFHQLIFAPNFVCNGSLIGYNNYAERIKADCERPQQAFFLVDSKHGMTIKAPIILTE